MPSAENLSAEVEGDIEDVNGVLKITKICLRYHIKAPAGKREAIERHLNFARNLHIETRVLEGADEAETLVDFARRNGVTQILIGRPPKTMAPLVIARRHQLVLRIIGLAQDMQVTVVAERRVQP